MEVSPPIPPHQIQQTTRVDKARSVSVFFLFVVLLLRSPPLILETVSNNNALLSVQWTFLADTRTLSFLQFWKTFKEDTVGLRAFQRSAAS